MTRSLLVVFCLFSLGSCYNPELPAGVTPCGGANGCPDGLVCQSERCWQGGLSNICPQGGFQVGKGIYACHANFEFGNMEGLCGPKARICENGAAIDLTTCNAAPGFYALNGGITEDGKCLVNGASALTLPRLDPPQPPEVWLVGCGTSKNLKRLSTACRGLKTALDCDGTEEGWFCGTVGLRGARHKDAVGGVLCCTE